MGVGTKNNILFEIFVLHLI